MSDAEKYDVSLPRVEVIGSLPPGVEESLCNTLLEAGDVLSDPDRLTHVRHAIHGRKILDYKKNWAAFAYLYFGANYIKAHLAGRLIKARLGSRPLRVIDLGCGSGASTLGILSGVLGCGSNSDAQFFDVVAVDRCEEQIRAFDRIVRPWFAQNLPNTAITSVNQDLFDFLRDDELDADFIVLSYVMAELSPEQQTHVWELLEKKVGGRQVEVVVIESAPSGKGIVVEGLDRKPYLVSYDEVQLKLPMLASLGLSLLPKFSTNRQESNVIKKYFDAWMNHDSGCIREIFARDASYEILGAKTLKGIDEIVRYWDHNSRTQRNVLCSATSEQLMDGGIAVSWCAEFDRIDCHEHRRLDGMLWLLFRDGKIEKLTEAYSQKAFSIQ